MVTSLLSLLGHSNNQKLVHPRESAVVKDIEEVSCRFCHASLESGFEIYYEDTRFIAFSDIKPASVHHLLVIPKEHIESVRSLEPTTPNVELLRDMKAVGNRLLDEAGVPEHMRRMGFHIPPLNSVYHLHLHVQGLPYRSILRAIKYPVARGAFGLSKGLTWFVEIDQAIRLLDNRKRIEIRPC